MGLFLNHSSADTSTWITGTEIVQGCFSKENENMINRKGNGFCKARTRGQGSPKGAIFKETFIFWLM